jgi:hypothetical protein
MAGEDEGDEMRPEVGSPGHERRHNDGGSSSSRKQRRARESERDGGKVWGALGVVLAFYRVLGSNREGWLGQ